MLSLQEAATRKCPTPSSSGAPCSLTRAASTAVPRSGYTPSALDRIQVSYIDQVYSWVLKKRSREFFGIIFNIM
jgi:hypothetical protein